VSEADMQFLVDAVVDVQADLSTATAVVDRIRAQNGQRPLGWQTLDADYAETVRLARNPVVAALGQFGLPSAREEFIATIRETRDRFDGVSAAQWLAWDTLLQAALKVTS
jgi:hypothetical protein